MGTDTGRFASGGKFRFLDENDEPVVLNSINSQNIPSHNPEVRLLFKATVNYDKCYCENNVYEIEEGSEVETNDGWKNVKELKVGDIIIGDESQDTIINIGQRDRTYLIYV